MSDLTLSADNDSGDLSPESVPAAIIERDRWVCWQYEQGGDKKPPYDPRTGKKSSTNEPETWSDFETALKTYQAGDYDGVGFVLVESDNLFGVDYDDCRDPETGEIGSEAEHTVEHLDTYTEVSPGRDGLHILASGEKPDEVGSRSGDGLEVYDSGQYFTFTGNHLDSTPETIEERNEELREICEEHLTERKTENSDNIRELPNNGPDDDVVTQAQEYIRDFMHGQKTGARAREYYSDLLKGKYAERGFEGDRSGAETTLCTLTYGILLDGGADPEEARNLTYHYVNHGMTENPRTEKHQEVRKWLEGTSEQQRKYRQYTLDYAIKNFDLDIWNLWRQSGKDETTNDYCEYAYEVALDALYNLTMECDLLEPPHLSTNNTPATCGSSPDSRSYPTMAEITERAQEMYELTDDSYREILRRIRRDGAAKMARLDSTTFVYLPASYPDPADACYVRVEGEKRDPESESEFDENGSAEVMTDGGQQMKGSRHKLVPKRDAG